MSVCSQLSQDNNSEVQPSGHWIYPHWVGPASSDHSKRQEATFKVQATIITRISSPAIHTTSSIFSHLKIPVRGILTIGEMKQSRFRIIDLLALRITKEVGFKKQKTGSIITNFIHNLKPVYYLNFHLLHKLLPASFSQIKTPR